MKKAIFLDFYGTVVHEDGLVIKKIVKEIFETGQANDKSEVGGYWYTKFRILLINSYGNAFRTQRDLEIQSLEETIEHFHSTADILKLSNMMFENWIKPPIFKETKKFFELSELPIFVVSNIDRKDILQAIEFHQLKPAGVFTSEDAKSYKPRKELFELALNSLGYKSEEVIHIGDSLSNDIEGANKVGIQSLWVNREKREVPEGVVAISDLLDTFRLMI